VLSGEATNTKIYNKEVQLTAYIKKIYFYQTHIRGDKLWRPINKSISVPNTIKRDNLQVAHG